MFDSDEEKKLWARQQIELDELKKRQGRRSTVIQHEAQQNIGNTMSGVAKIAHRILYELYEKSRIKADAEEREALAKKHDNEQKTLAEKGTDKTIKRKFEPPKDDGRLLAEELDPGERAKQAYTPEMFAHEELNSVLDRVEDLVFPSEKEHFQAVDHINWSLDELVKKTAKLTKDEQFKAIIDWREQTLKLYSKTEKQEEPKEGLSEKRQKSLQELKDGIEKPRLSREEADELAEKLKREKQERIDIIMANAAKNAQKQEQKEEPKPELTRLEKAQLYLQNCEETTQKIRP